MGSWDWALLGTTLAAVTGPVKLTRFAIALGITAALVGAACIAASILLFLLVISNPFGWMAIAAVVLVASVLVLTTGINYAQRSRAETERLASSTNEPAQRGDEKEQQGRDLENNLKPEIKLGGNPENNPFLSDTVTDSTQSFVDDRSQTNSANLGDSGSTLLTGSGALLSENSTTVTSTNIDTSSSGRRPSMSISVSGSSMPYLQLGRRVRRVVVMEKVKHGVRQHYPLPLKMKKNRQRRREQIPCSPMRRRSNLVK